MATCRRKLVDSRNGGDCTPPVIPTRPNNLPALREAQARCSGWTLANESGSKNAITRRAIPEEARRRTRQNRLMTLQAINPATGQVVGAYDDTSIERVTVLSSTLTTRSSTGAARNRRPLGAHSQGRRRTSVRASARRDPDARSSRSPTRTKRSRWPTTRSTAWAVAWSRGTGRRASASQRSSWKAASPT
ncbi:MAG: hypothetical protein JWN13_5098 [Betaproteobacteria bacterium]|jgi:hypothetical protein|nr:hypothetical protein [Betaproteobacteria bacterium]